MVHEQDKDEQMKLYLDALAQAYDPHSEYLSKADMKNFSINMGLSLVGIGAMLRSEDGYAKSRVWLSVAPRKRTEGSRSATASLLWRRARRNTSMFARCDSISRRNDSRKERHTRSLACDSLRCGGPVGPEECRVGT